MGSWSKFQYLLPWYWIDLRSLNTAEKTKPKDKLRNVQKKVAQNLRGLPARTRRTSQRAKQWSRHRIFSRDLSRLPTSPVPRALLRSNVGPTEAQTLAVRKYISQVTALESERDIGPTRQAARQKTIKEALQGRIEAHQRVLSPIRRLPPEILQHIFHFLLPSTIFEESPSGFPQSRSFSIPTPYCNVSRHFRSAALALPSLWTSLPLININDPHTKTRSYRSWLRRVLSLSGCLPLDVRIAWNTTLVRSNPSHPSYPALNVLQEHAQRWRSAVINLPPSIAANTFLGNGKPYPILQHVEIFGIRIGNRGHGRAAGDGSKSTKAPYFDSPNLQSITLRGESVLNQGVGASPIPLLHYLASGLTHSGKDRQSQMQQSLRILRISNPRLRGVRFETTMDEIPILALPFVEELQLECASINFSNNLCLLERLQLPALERITVESHVSLDVQTTSLNNLLSRSQTMKSLKYLSLICIKGCGYICCQWHSRGTRQVAQLLNENTCLEVFEMDSPNYTTLLSLINENPDGRVLFPSLKTLILGEAECVNLDDVSHFIRSLTSRAVHAPMLETIELKLLPEVHSGGGHFVWSPDVVRRRRYNLEGWVISRLFPNRWTSGMRNLDTILVWLQELDAIEVESNVFGVMGLYHAVSDLSLAIAKRTLLFSNEDQLVSGTEVTSKARALLDKWRPALGTYTRLHGHWFFVRNSNRLRFIPLQHGLRLTATDDELVDGFDRWNYPALGRKQWFHVLASDVQDASSREWQQGNLWSNSPLATECSYLGASCSPLSRDLPLWGSQSAANLSHSVLPTTFMAIATDPLLPSEILFSIASHAWDDFKTLSALSSVNHSFNHHARSIMFARIRIISYSKAIRIAPQLAGDALLADVAAFSSLFLSNSTLGQHVRELSLSRLYISCFETDALLPILLNVSNIRVLRLDIIDSPQQKKAEDFKSQVRSSNIFPTLLSHIRSPHLSTLRLSGDWFDWPFITMFIAPATQLKHLTLCYVRFSCHPQPHPAPTPALCQELLPSSAPIRLSSLSIDVELATQFLKMADIKRLDGKGMIEVSSIRHLVCRKGEDRYPWTAPGESPDRETSVNLCELLSRVSFLESFALEGFLLDQNYLQSPGRNRSLLSTLRHFTYYSGTFYSSCYQSSLPVGVSRSSNLRHTLQVIGRTAGSTLEGLTIIFAFSKMKDDQWHQQLLQVVKEEVDRSRFPSLKSMKLEVSSDRRGLSLLETDTYIEQQKEVFAKLISHTFADWTPGLEVLSSITFRNSIHPSVQLD